MIGPARGPVAAMSAGRGRTMRRFATGLLVAMAVLFGVARGLARAHPAWGGALGWPLAFAEAALVGGLADWFAVTALFRHPLGLPIPHTAIIPANKDRIAESMARFLSTHFLTPGVVARRMAAVNIARGVGLWLADPQKSAEVRLRQGAGALAEGLLAALDGERQLGRLAKRALRQRLATLDLAPLLGQLLAAAMAKGRHRPLLEAGLRWVGLTLEANEELLRGIIHARANVILRWTGLDERLAGSILDGLYRLLAECIVNPAHPLRLHMEAGLARLAEDLVADPALRARVARAKAGVLANPALGAWLDELWEDLRNRLLAAARAPAAGQVVGQVAGGAPGSGGLAGFGATLASNPGLQATVNRFLRRAVAGTVSRHAAGIVTLVSATVKRWNSRTIAERIEGSVGRDLQFIRINGTLVGGLVGLALHAIARLF